MRKFLLIFAVAILALVATLAFGLATVSGSSEVALHIFTDEDFVRFRTTSILVGALAAALDCFLLVRLYRVKPKQQ